MYKFLLRETDFSGATCDDESPGDLTFSDDDDASSPAAEDSTAVTIFQLAPLACAAVGMMVWTFTSGAEALQRLRSLGQPCQGNGPEKPQLPQSRWPESWTHERRSIEL